MFFSRRRSKGSPGADAAEAEVTTLRDKLQALKVSTAQSTGRIVSPAKLKSASSVRADAAEAELARMREQMEATPKKKFLKFSCKIGWCSHDGNCGSNDGDLERLNRRLAVMEHEMEQMQRFGEIRNEMERKIAIVEQEIRQKYGSSNALDLVIVMDCTGSMSGWIDQAKSSIISIINNVRLVHPKAGVRIGFVAYRDFCDGNKRLQVQTLTSNVRVVRDFIASLEAFGGGDHPEDIPGGLAAALEMPFQAEAKRIVLVADAPCHGRKFHENICDVGLSDDMLYRSAIERSPDICAQMREIAGRGIDFTFIGVIPAYTAKMVKILQSEFKDIKNYDGFGREFRNVPLEKTAHFGSVISSSASASISAGLKRSVIASQSNAMEGSERNYTTHLYQVLEEEEEDEDKPSEVVVDVPPIMKLNWSDLTDSPEIAAVRHSLHFSPDDNVDWKALNLKHTQQKTKIRLSRSCFAKGAMRSAHALYDCNMKKYLVAKFYFGKAAQKLSASKRSLQNDVETQIVAKRLATEFSLSERVENGVDFISTCWYEMNNPVEAGLHPCMTMFTAEPFIDGEYKKYNNNKGWVSDDGLNLGETAQAFSHFTWQKTCGELMVVDIQGVGCIFTDPQIHSKDGERFGCGNLSDAGMEAFFVTHKCNSVCKALGLDSVKQSEADAHNEAGMEQDGGHKDSTKKSANKSMTCSCPLCGEITTVLRQYFVEAYRVGGEVYCKSCISKTKRSLRLKCSLCRKRFDYSPYWFSMKGIAIPTSCKNCEGGATKRSTG
ncbi:unnamed protein product [Phytophthora fragariaefolia]|uniref:Unnamed protein product n=1 Tax=Phytophthora fragariaefolia TaxID=1490495 RepID=A0A9W6XG17_9STRA|nr:unnamed protein product [Phytophthora fragariaefolia]